MFVLESNKADQSFFAEPRERVHSLSLHHTITSWTGNFPHNTIVIQEASDTLRANCRHYCFDPSGLFSAVGDQQVAGGHWAVTALCSGSCWT